MSIFTNKPTLERSAVRIEAAPPEGAMSLIASGMRIIGDIESTGVVKVEGMIEGTVRAARQVLLGRSGVIQGDVHAGDAVIGGRIVGAVMATDRVEVQSTATIEGDIHTKSIIVYEGGSINGTVRMGESSTIPLVSARSVAVPSVRLATEG